WHIQYCSQFLCRISRIFDLSGYNIDSWGTDVRSQRHTVAVDDFSSFRFEGDISAPELLSTICKHIPQEKLNISKTQINNKKNENTNKQRSSQPFSNGHI